MTQWPPLITKGKRERWMVWRDAAITLLVWGIFLYLFVTQSILFGETVDSVAQKHPGAFMENWRFRLKPFGVLVLILLIWLVGFGWWSLRNWKRVIREPVPSPLAIETESARRGMTVEDVLEARSFKIAAVSIDDAVDPSARYHVSKAT